MIKQPALGRKVAELRKAKGLTQEELVEMCNISVRTIQRIETGEVTPRSYTVKTILTALDYDLDKIAEEDKDTQKPASNWLSSFMLTDTDSNKPPAALLNPLNMALIFGIGYFVLQFFEDAADLFWFIEGEMLFGGAVFIGVKVLILLSFVFFQRGFIVVAGLYNNHLLKVISLILIGAKVLVVGCDIISVSSDFLEREFVLLLESFLFGAIGILFGISLLKLKKSVGRIAKLTGAIEILAACFFLTVALSFVGSILHVPAELLELIIIFKVIEKIKVREMAYSLSQQ